MASRAYNRGFQTGQGGRSKDLCPHQQIDLRAQWLAGWREGRGAFLEGYTGVAGLDRIAV
jgi:ribosome modulation factor